MSKRKFKFKPNKSIDGKGGCTNGERAERGNRILRGYLHGDLGAPLTDEMDASTISYLLSDIFHYCHRENIDFEKVSDCAKLIWRDER